MNKNLSRLVKIRAEELVEQKEGLEKLVDDKTREILKSERLSAIGELSGRLVHDLRNPLSVMKMSVDLIKQNPSETKISDPNVINRLDLIEKSIDRIAHQVDEVLDFVRLSPLKLSSVSIRETVQNSISKINIPDNIQIDISDKDLEIKCDTVKLDAVFLNLLVNAIQAIPGGGKIEIKISQQTNLAVLDFIDSGEGVSDDNLEKIFEPLFTTKQKGTGLGLSSCKNIIEQHNGTISVKNNPSTFSVILPLNVEEPSKFKL